MKTLKRSEWLQWFHNLLKQNKNYLIPDIFGNDDKFVSFFFL